MHLLDASSIIHAWDNYPIEQFPPFWVWMQETIQKGQLGIPRKAYDEVEDRCPDCHAWLKNNNVHVVQVNSPIIAEANRIKGILGIQDDNYHPKGVGENDILIVATAKILGLPLVSNESVQPKLPDEMRKCKIPAVCDLPQVGVKCMSLIKFIKQVGGIFT